LIYIQIGISIFCIDLSGVHSLRVCWSIFINIRKTRHTVIGSRFNNYLRI